MHACIHLQDTDRQAPRSKRCPVDSDREGGRSITQCGPREPSVPFLYPSSRASAVATINQLHGSTDQCTCSEQYPPSSSSSESSPHPEHDHRRKRGCETTCTGRRRRGGEAAASPTGLPIPLSKPMRREAHPKGTPAKHGPKR